ncbi:MAG TPA: CHAT domain-containing protein [Ideonella sp.]|uniref:CHAT domain-containing protein n=1 Tax=Ideonella sp. TaxID=1929293 RepID=UPI002E32CC03|nr:CHAT domain-containing protein [Ideonella sp.]HEX5688126.1 CHAT domain-containing protein [Ideonella sp.]
MRSCCRRSRSATCPRTAALADPVTPTERAQRLLDEGAATPPALDLALAWALKDACYAAWSTAPRRAAQAAELLNQGLRQIPATVTAPAQMEIAALAAWTHGIALITQGRMADAVAAFDDARTRFDQLDQPGLAAQTQVPKIMALAMLGRREGAAACAERTHAAFVAQGDVRAASKVSLNLGSLHLRHDDYPQAARHYREAARLFAKVEDHEHSVMADIGLADALTGLGDLDEAERICTRARARAAAHGLPVLQAMVDESAALLDLSRGRFGAALAGFERARAGYERLAMPQHLAIAEKQLADAYLELRLLPEADALFAQALQKFDALAMPNDKAWTLAQRGRGQALGGNAVAAAAHFDAALALFEAQDNQAGLAAVALARAELAVAQQDPVDSLRWADLAVAAHASAGSDDGAVRAALVRAQALAVAGHAAQARAAFGATLAQARASSRLSAEVRSLVGLASAEQALGHDDAARIGFESAVALFEELRLALPGDEVRRVFLADHLRPYRELLRYALQDHARAATPATAAAVLRAADRARARTLSERLAGGVGDAAAVDESAQALRARVSWLSRRVQGLEDDDDTPSVTLVDELRESEQRLLEHVRRQRLAGVVAPAQAAAGHPLDVDAVCAALADDEVLIEYARLDDEWLACVLKRDGITVQRQLAGSALLMQALQAAQFQLDALGHGATPMEAHLTALTTRCGIRLQQLHALVWAPLAASVGDARRVLLVAPAPLGSIPFAALTDGQRTLAERHQLVWLPSASAALRHAAGQENRSPRRVLVVGESVRLPHAGDEARAVVAAFAAADAATELRLDGDATVDFMRSRAANADLLHLACHAQFRADSPGFSALHLHDGALTAEQVETLRLHARVVVLSACETAGREPGASASRGDEWVGLVRSFLLAGAAQVIASLWPVDDRVTARFMAGFYRALAQGLVPAAALRQAQLTLREQHPHPFHWAAFALYGGG